MPLASHTAEIAVDSPLIGARIDRLIQQLCGLSRSQVIGLFDHGCVRRGGALCTQPGERLAAGDRVELRYDPHQRYHPTNKPRRNLGFDLVFEDKHLIVVIKPAELLTVPTVRHETNTLQHKVEAYVRHVGGGRGAFTVHRLDRGVSGLLVLGKTQEIVRAIKDQFALNKPEREYIALVAGHLAQAQGTFESLLATDKDLNRFSTDDEQIGQRAVTHYRVISRLADTTLVQVRLETGRRNQIRVHFAEAGHPVLGDPRYQPERAAHSDWRHQRLALHARLLGFEHPVTGEPLRFEAELPAEMARFIKQQGSRGAVRG
ncbi:MAG: RluA family pseudouridine synthase [Pirellulaceae bacterium]|nr:RluA family pseudouridine synthase [Pirellulaceae bacterium]